jgi:small subunit ribosomal protein S6
MTEAQGTSATPSSEANSGSVKLRLREYETLLLAKADLTDEHVERLKERVRGVIQRDGGKVLKFTNWGKKKTAFPVANQLRAIFLHVNYLAKPGTVSEVERSLSLAEDATKYMTVLLATDIDPETRIVEPDAKLMGDADEKSRERESEGDRTERANLDGGDDLGEEME